MFLNYISFRFSFNDTVSIKTVELWYLGWFPLCTIWTCILIIFGLHFRFYTIVSSIPPRTRTFLRLRKLARCIGHVALWIEPISIIFISLLAITISIWYFCRGNHFLSPYIDVVFSGTEASSQVSSLHCMSVTHVSNFPMPTCGLGNVDVCFSEFGTDVSCDCGFLNDTISNKITGGRMVEWVMKDELERIWKQGVVS